MIELAEGETLPVVDEAGNTLGTLHHDGRVLDGEGNVIGGLDDDGNVVLHEQQAPEGELRGLCVWGGCTSSSRLRVSGVWEHAWSLLCASFCTCLTPSSHLHNTLASPASQPAHMEWVVCVWGGGAEGGMEGR